MNDAAGGYTLKHHGTKLTNTKAFWPTKNCLSTLKYLSLTRTHYRHTSPAKQRRVKCVIITRARWYNVNIITISIHRVSSYYINNEFIETFRYYTG